MLQKILWPLVKHPGNACNPVKYSYTRQNKTKILGRSTFSSRSGTKRGFCISQKSNCKKYSWMYFRPKTTLLSRLWYHSVPVSDFNKENICQSLTESKKRASVGPSRGQKKKRSLKDFLKRKHFLGITKKK